MKILYFGGGLGNQIFEYAFYLHLRKKYPTEKIYGIYSNKRFKEHKAGFELSRVFDVKLPPSSMLAVLIMNVIMGWNKYVKRTDIYCHNLTTPHYDALLFNAFKMNKLFYEDLNDWISFKHFNIDVRNFEIIECMKQSNSVAIHVRRGDFLSHKYAAKHAGVATLEYYNKAIMIINKMMENPQFFIFSDDIDWCKDNLTDIRAYYIDFNKEKDSYMDMYLMTFCKANIIANSTFSYWGAYLNRNDNIVLYPSKWRHSEADELDIFPNSWIQV